MWGHRSSAPSGPLPKKYIHTCLSMQILKRILWEKLLICEGVFKYFSSFSLIFFLILNTLKNRCYDTCEHSGSSAWVILSISVHPAHLAQSYFSLIYSAIIIFNCSWIYLTKEKKCSDWRQMLCGKWPMLTTFLLMAIAAITGKTVKVCYRMAACLRTMMRKFSGSGEVLSAFLHCEISMFWQVMAIGLRQCHLGSIDQRKYQR